MNREHWNRIYDMYIRKYDEVINEIKTNKFPITDTMTPSEKLDILFKREDAIASYLKHEAAMYRLNWAMEVNL